MGLVGLIALGVCVVVALVWSVFSRRRFRGLMSARREIPFDSIFTEYYAPVGIDCDEARSVWDGIARALNVPAGKLRPTDRFGVELAPDAGWGYDDCLGLVEDALREAAARKQVIVDLKSLSTVDDCIKALCTGSGSKGPAHET